MRSMVVNPVQILSGHVSEDTAFLVDDYPYGFALRCKIRYWVESPIKGAGKGQQRFVSQTTNPKRPGEPWNKPKTSTYSSLVVMYLNEDEHVKSFHVNFHVTPEGDARFRLMGLYDQLDESTRVTYDQLVRIAQKYAEPWDTFEEAVTALADYIREHEAAPEFDADSWAWVSPTDRRFSIPEYARDVYLTLAHQRADGKA